jgi:hypothetical protein
MHSSSKRIREGLHVEDANPNFVPSPVPTGRWDRGRVSLGRSESAAGIADEPGQRTARYSTPRLVSSRRYNNLPWEPVNAVTSGCLTTLLKVEV